MVMKNIGNAVLTISFRYKDVIGRICGREAVLLCISECGTFEESQIFESQTVSNSKNRKGDSSLLDIL